MEKPSTSPERGTFLRDAYIKETEHYNTEPDPEILKMYKEMNDARSLRESNPEWQQNNLEYDLRTTQWILDKVRNSDSYAQNLYAALCNNEFVKLEVVPILKGEKWGCSWRSAGGIIANMLERGDYIDWYCSGIDPCPDSGFVAEQVITSEIKEDLKKLGWAAHN